MQMNNLRLCMNLVNTVAGANFPPLERFPQAEQVAYNYYLGRLMIFEEKYDKVGYGCLW